MTPDDMIRIAAARERLFRCIEDELNRDGHHKSYEGAIDITVSLPNIFERNTPPQWTIEWHCYVVPESGRHISWQGRTLAEAVVVMEAAVEKICFPYEMTRFERSMESCVDDTDFDGSTEGAGPNADFITYGDSRKEDRRGDS